LFDQRCANLEPAYEKISLINLQPVSNSISSSSSSSNQFKMQHSIDEEFIDLTNVGNFSLQESKKTSAANNKTKKFNSKINKNH